MRIGIQMSDTIKIGPILYRIEEFDEVPGGINGNMPMGRQVEAHGKILLMRQMPDDVKRVTTWHEILHALGDQNGQELNEGLINAFANGIVQVLADNLWLREPT
jgi:hypothetical protein